MPETWTEAETQELSVPGTQNTAVIDGLIPALTYHVRIMAQNGVGISLPSEVIQVATAEEAPEGTPQDIHVEAISSTKLKVRWGPPERRLWHGTILGYYLGYRELNLANFVDGSKEVISSSSSNGAVGSNKFRENTTPIHFAAPHHFNDNMHGYHFRTVEVCVCNV